VTYETVKLAEGKPINWELRDHEKIVDQRIGGPLSIRLESCTDVLIEGCELVAIQLIGCKEVTIRNCWIHDSARVGVELGGCTQVTVQGCRLERVATGVYAEGSQQVQVRGTFMRNMVGPLPRGSAVQFDEVTGAGSAICDNYAFNERGKSHPEDVISLFKSQGTAESPILIEGNYVAGDPAEGSRDKSENGSGIMLGDYGGAHLLCRKNVVVAAGQVGMGVAGGTDIRVEENVIYGGKSNVTTSGLYVWNQSKLPSARVKVIGNRVSWVNKDGEETSWWEGGGVDELAQTGNTFADPTLPASLPTPPTQAPLPPKPWLTVDANGKSVARLPWKVE
jgi:hypothetical protein